MMQAQPARSSSAVPEMRLPSSLFQRICQHRAVADGDERLRLLAAGADVDGLLGNRRDIFAVALGEVRGQRADNAGQRLPCRTRSRCCRASCGSPRRRRSSRAESRFHRYSSRPDRSGRCARRAECAVLRFCRRARRSRRRARPPPPHHRTKAPVPPRGTPPPHSPACRARRTARGSAVRFPHTFRFTRPPPCGSLPFPIKISAQLPAKQKPRIPASRGPPKARRISANIIL